MLLTIAEFRERLRVDMDGLVTHLQEQTGRAGDEEAHAWRASLPSLDRALAVPAMGGVHIYFAGSGSLALEYQLPAASSWCDVVLLGRGPANPAAVVVELKDWITRSDRPGPAEGLIEHGGRTDLHPSDQVRGYVEYCRRFHSTVQDHAATVDGLVLFTRDRFADAYAAPPNEALAREFPFFTLAPEDIQQGLPTFLLERIKSPDGEFARAFVEGRYRQDRGFVSQIGAQIRDRKNTPFELLDHQRRAFAMVKARIEQDVLANRARRKRVIVIEGPPGSGKSVLAARIWAEFVTNRDLPDGSVVLTTTSTAQTSNWAGLFTQVGRSRAAGGVVKKATSYVPVSTHALGRLRNKYGQDFAVDANRWREHLDTLRNLGVPFHDGGRDDQYLVSIVDEAHALINPEHTEGRGQFGFAPSLGPLAYHIIRCSSVSIFLLDAQQGFRDRENTTLSDIRLWAGELGAEIMEGISLAGAQFRCGGSAEYVEWVDAVLAGAEAGEAGALTAVWRKTFDVRMVHTPFELEAELRNRLVEGRSARLVASYAREWKTKGAARPHLLPPKMLDFHEPYRRGRKAVYWSKPWNFIPRNGSDYTWFIQAPPESPMHDDPLCEVGCPYAVRGFDFGYVGVLWLNDLVWRKDRWTVNLESVHDTGLLLSLRAARKEGGEGPATERLRNALAQAYRILLTRGIYGCYLWVEDMETRMHLWDCLAMGGRD